jgi:general stress protein 26
MTHVESREQFHGLLSSFSTAMLVTRSQDDELWARPMSIASIEPDDELWFVTGIGSQKAGDVIRDKRVVVVLQSPSKFASVSGEAEVIVNVERARRLWSESQRPWFPDGPSDPQLALVRVRPHFVEFWDLSGLHGVRFFWKAMQHAIKGERMSDTTTDESHARVHLWNA